MICPACDYVMSAFDKTCPRCALAGDRAVAPTPRPVAAPAQQGKSTGPVDLGVTVFLVIYQGLLAVLSFAVMFCLCSLLFALLTGGLKEKTGIKVMSEAKTGVEALGYLFVDAIKVGWFFGLLGGATSAYPILRNLQRRLAQTE